MEETVVEPKEADPFTERTLVGVVDPRPKLPLFKRVNFSMSFMLAAAKSLPVLSLKPVIAKRAVAVVVPIPTAPIKVDVALVEVA